MKEPNVTSRPKNQKCIIHWMGLADGCTQQKKKKELKIQPKKKKKVQTEARKEKERENTYIHTQSPSGLWVNIKQSNTCKLSVEEIFEEIMAEIPDLILKIYIYQEMQ